MKMHEAVCRRVSGARSASGRLHAPVRVALVVAACGLPLAALATPSVTVNDAGDAGPGNCASICTLRDAIAVVPIGGTVLFAPGILPATITLTHGELAITKSLNIQGPGAARLAISANHAGRVVHVTNGSALINAVMLRDGTVTGSVGSSPGAGSALAGGLGGDGSGGCVAIEAGTTLFLIHVDVRNCTATGGAGGAGGSGPDNSGSLNGPGIDGGAGGGGGSGAGGAIFVAGSLSLFNSSVSASEANGGDGGRGGDGGLGGVAVMNGSGGQGGTAGSGLGGAVHVAGGASAWIENSTLSDSQCVGGTGGRGGDATSASATVHSGNGGYGGYGMGGSLFVSPFAPLADLEFATLANGALAAGAGGQAGIASGGATPGAPGSAGSALGYDVYAPNDTSALSTVVAGIAPGALCSANFSVGTGVANLDQDSSCNGFTLHGTLAQLFKPFDTSVALPAYLPVYGSAVIDAAANCTNLAAGTVTDDEHGTPRPQGSQCDLGAIEADYLFVGTFD